MSSIDLVILGFIKKGPLSAYDLATVVERTQMTKWLKIGLPTVYQNLRKLADKGYLTADSVSKGSMPDKTLYAITAAGEEHWLALMRRYSSTPGNIYFDFNAFVINMGLLDPASRLEMLENLRLHFRREKEGLSRSIEVSGTVAAEGRAVMDQYLRLFGTLIAWIDGMIEGQGAAPEGGARKSGGKV